MGLRLRNSCFSSRSRWLLAIALLLSLAACMPVAPVAHDPGLKMSRAAFSDVPPKAAKEITEGTLDVYVDASQSMKGFVQPAGETDYKQVVREALQAAAIMPGWKVARYKFAPVEDVTSKVVGDFLQPEFYQGNDTPLADLLKRATSEQNRSHTTMIVTDLVLSQTGVDEAQFAAMVRDLAKNGVEVKLIAFRSAFEGDYTPEYGGSAPPKLHMSVKEVPGDKESGRPFYVLVVAPNTGSMEQVSKYVLSKCDTWTRRRFSPTAPVIRIKDFDVPKTNASGNKGAPAKTPGPSLRTFSTDKREVASSTPTLYTSFIEQRAPTGGNRHALEAVISYEAALAFVDAGRFDLQVDKVTFQGTKPGKINPMPNLGIQRTGSCFPVASNIGLAFDLDRPAKGTFDVYRVRYSVGGANLKLPPWVDEWSTKDDRVAVNAGKTYQLSLLVTSMLQAMTEKQLFLTHYFAVGKS